MAMAILVFRGTSKPLKLPPNGGIVGALWECEPSDINNKNSFFRESVPKRPEAAFLPKLHLLLCVSQTVVFQ